VDVIEGLKVTEAVDPALKDHFIVSQNSLELTHQKTKLPKKLGAKLLIISAYHSDLILLTPVHQVLHHH